MLEIVSNFTAHITCILNYAKYRLLSVRCAFIQFSAIAEVQRKHKYENKLRKARIR